MSVALKPANLPFGYRIEAVPVNHEIRLELLTGVDSSRRTVESRMVRADQIDDDRAMQLLVDELVASAVARTRAAKKVAELNG